MGFSGAVLGKVGTGAWYGVGGWRGGGIRCQ